MTSGLDRRRQAESFYGLLPETFCVLPFNYVTRVRNGQVDPTLPEHRQKPLIAPDHLESGTGRLLAIESAEDQGAESGKYPVEIGDIVYSKIRPALRKVTISPVDGLCSADMYAIKTVEDVDSRFLFWLILSEGFSRAVVLESMRVAMPKVNRETLGAVPVCFPPIAQQRAIADFLDKKTAAIDALIAKKERLIELLQEKRQALITQAVTKGLDPNVPMKDSGVEWLGEIPAHWEVKRVKHLMSHIVDCPHSTPEYSEEGEYPAIRTADVDRGRLLLDGARRVMEAVYRDRVQRLVPAEGDILYSREGERFGMAALVPAGVKLCLAQRMMMFRTSRANHPAFAMWLLNSDSLYQQVLQDTVGATSPRINIPTVNNAWVAVPSEREQADIARELAARLRRIDEILVHVTKHCATLREYRQALITEAVTGKLDIAQEADRDLEVMVGQPLEAAP